MIKNKVFSIFLSLVLFFTYTTPISFAKASKSLSIQEECLLKSKLYWWEGFNDPCLVEHLNKALSKNYDLKETFLKVLVSREKVRESFGKELPQATLISNFIRINTPFSGRPGINRYENFFTLPLFANYEIDLWRKNRKGTLAQAEMYEAMKQEALAAYILLIAEVASAYFNTLNLDKLITLQEKYLTLEIQNLEIAKANLETGLIANDEFFTAQKNVLEAQKVLTELDKQRRVFINQLLVLTGESPENEVMRNSLDRIKLPENIPFEISSDKILKRPDILEIEALLKNSKINIELAKKDFLPNINLYGLFAFNSGAFKNVFNWEDYIVSVGTALVGRLFTGGQRRSRLKQRKLEYEQMLQHYQQTILNSLQEVNNSLYSLKRNLEINNDDLNKIKFESANLNLINVKYEKGLSAYKETIPSQKKVLLLQQDESQSKTGYLIDSLNLYKALGSNL